MVRPMRYPELYEGPGDEGEYHPVAIARTMYVDSIDRSAAQTIVEQLQASTAMMAVTQLRVLGGAAARVPVEATAYAHRQSRIMVNVAVLFEGARAGARARALGRRTGRRSPSGRHGRLRELPRRRGRGANPSRVPGATWDRLVEVKRRYDPTNLFRLNQNIPPG